MTEPVMPASVAEARALADETRAEIAATIDELVSRVDPRTQASKLLSTGQQMIADAGPAERRRAWIILGVGIGIATIGVAIAIRRATR
jgi:hypothetical protein